MAKHTYGPPGRVQLRRSNLVLKDPKQKPIHWRPSQCIAMTRCGLECIQIDPQTWTYHRQNVTCKCCLAAMRRPLLERSK